MTRVTYRLELAYDGAAFRGYARQPGLRTVEGALADALAEFLPDRPGLPCGGRTDRGVHATAQVVSFWSRGSLPIADVAARIEAAGAGDLVVQDLRVVPRWFHARYSASQRRYVYLHDDPSVDVARLDRLLGALVGLLCFSAFARDTPPGANTRRALDLATARRSDGGRIRFDFAARSFLRRQVRVLVATALREAIAGADDHSLVQIAATGDRRASAHPAEPGGLYLSKIAYAPR